MKIAVWHNLPSGGGKRALYSQVQGLVERGHTVEAWCPPTADQSYLPLGDLIPEHVVPLRTHSDPRTLGRRLLMSRRHPVGHVASFLDGLAASARDMAVQVSYMDEHCRLCAEQIDRAGFDLLLAHPCIAFRVTAIGRLVHIPKVLYLQEPYRQLYEALPALPWLAPPPSSKPARSLGRMKDRLSDIMSLQGIRLQAREELRNACAYDTILVNSYFSRESVLRVYGLSAKVCYLGIDTRLFQPRQLPKGDFVVGVGALVMEKNIAFVIEALARVREPRPRLVWIGNVAVTSYVDQLKQLARDRGVVLETIQRVDDDILVRLLNEALFMVYAPRLEPFGFAPLEANACGTPVVAVAEGGVRETILDGVNGLLVDHDPKSMAAAITQLLDDPELTARLAEGGLKSVEERWTQNGAIDRLEAHLNEALLS